MASSMQHGAIMMGEFDDPDENVEPDSCNPLFSAGLFGIHYAIKTANDCLYSNTKLERRDASLIGAVIGQLLYALLADDDGLAQVIRDLATRYIGRPAQSDTDMVPEFKLFVRRLTNRIDEIETALTTGEHTKPLPPMQIYSQATGSNNQIQLLVPEITFRPSDGY